MVRADSRGSGWVLPALLPDILTRLQPAMLGTAMFDMALISSLALVEKLLLDTTSPALSLNLTTVCFFLIAFLVFALQERFYGKPYNTRQAEYIAAGKIVFLATLLTIFALQCSTPPPNSLPVLTLSWTSLCVLVGSRRVQHAFRSADHNTHNVLIIGNGNLARRTADAIRRDPSSGRCVKQCLGDTGFADSSGTTMLSKIARQEFIDEVIVATLDSEVAGAAIREAQRNQLGVRVAPELFGYVHADEDLPASVPLLNIYQPEVPEWALAVKRIADVVLASVGMLALLPVVLAISVAIKLDSSGPVFYHAPRVGRRGKRFECFKFRTMVERADVEKDSLRSRNERDGAFFKIANDPRITRIGRILRRYSLDELPQLWSVLLGDTSLVGPPPILPMMCSSIGLSTCGGLTSCPASPVYGR